MLTDTVISSGQLTASMQACWITHAPICAISPVCSAIGMNTSGGMRPLVGCFQRISASHDTTRPLSTLTIG